MQVDANLVVFKPDGSRMDIPLSVGTYSVGRSKECRLRVPLPNVSRQHCELRVGQDDLRVCDMGSSNGTFRNGLRLSPGDEVPLHAGDVVAIGAFQMTLQVDGEPASVTPPPPPPPQAPARAAKSAAPPVPSASGPSPASASAATAGPGQLEGLDDELEDLDETISRVGPPGLLGNSDSSAFDVDLDLDEDENPTA
ncbi:MAG: FHA domain-containing protein [Planctomycetota bacterium]